VSAAKKNWTARFDDAGAWGESWRFATTKEAVTKGLSRYPGSRVVLEVGCHSPWMSRQLKESGFEVIVANPRRVRLISQSDKKNDRSDAEQLARDVGGPFRCPLDRLHVAVRSVALLETSLEQARVADDPAEQGRSHGCACQ